MKVCRVGVVIERTGNQDIKVGVRSLAGCFHKVGTGDGAELGADEDRGTFLRG